MTSEAPQRSRKTLRREKLARAAADALAALPGATMVEIAEAIDASRATLYRHFPSREELIREVALVAIDDCDRATAHIGVGVATYRCAFELLFEAMIPLGARYHFLTGEASVMRDPLVAREVARQTREIREMVEGAKAAGELRAEIPSAFITSFIDALIYAAWSSVARGDVTSELAAKLAMDTLWNGAGAQLGE